MILAAEPGSGKSSLLCYLTAELLADPSCTVLFIDQPRHRSLLGCVQEGLGLPSSLPGWTHAVGKFFELHSSQRLLLLIDGLESFPDPGEPLRDMSACASALARAGANVAGRIVAAIRYERLWFTMDRHQRAHGTHLLPDLHLFVHSADHGSEQPYRTLQAFQNSEAAAA